MGMIMISACLCGFACRYDGKSNPNAIFKDMLSKGQVIPVCPEKLAGLCIPRIPSEIDNGEGSEVIAGKKRVISREGLDMTGYFLQGAQKTLDLAKVNHIDCAIMKSRSPSCGNGQIYDGTFTKTLRSGDGVTAAFLKKHGVRVISDEDYLLGGIDS